MRCQRGYSFQRAWGRWSRQRRTCHGERPLETRSRGTSRRSSPRQSESEKDKRVRTTPGTRANLTECRIKLLYRVKGYEHRLIEGLSASSLGDRRYTDQSFSLIKMTDNNLSFSIKSIFSHLFRRCEVHLVCVQVCVVGSYLKHSEDGCWEGVKVCCWRLIFKVKPKRIRMRTSLQREEKNNIIKL